MLDPPYRDEFAEYVSLYIHHWKDVVVDGSCGFKVVAHNVHTDQYQWYNSCATLWREMIRSKDMYIAVIGNTNYRNKTCTLWPGELEVMFQSIE